MGSKKRIQAAKKAAGGEISLRKACALLGVNRSSVYKAQKPSARAIKDQNLAEKIQAVQDSKRYTYGVDRMTAELRRQGVPVNHKRVWRVMKAYKLNAIIRKKRNWFCDVDKVVHTRLPGNLLNREFHADAPGQKLVSDVTYLPTADGHWCYASLVKDLCTSEIVACVVSKKQTLALGIETLNQLNGRTKPGALFHTDQGCIYTHPAFGNTLERLGAMQSLSRKGNCLDNAVIESFNGTMKCEWFYPKYGTGRWDLTFEQVAQMVFDYVNYYNEERIQKKLGYLTPTEYRRQIAQNQ